VGAGLSLQLNGGGTVAIAANGSFTFPTALASGAAYSVTAATQPSGPTQNCAIANGAGTVGSSNVTNVTVTCTTSSFTIGGTVAGLTGTGLVLENNAANALPVAANGAFTFSAAVSSGGAYAVTVATQPIGQTCAVANGAGTVGGGNVTNVAVTCAVSAGWLGIKQFGSTGGDEVTAMASHPGGGVYAAGDAAAPIAGAFGAAGGRFVARFDATGTRLWVYHFASAMQEVRGAATDATGNVYVVGYANAAYPGQTQVGSDDAIVIKLDPAGAVVWVRQLGTGNPDYGTGIAADGAGNTVVVGYTRAGARDDGFVQRLNASGTLNGAAEVITAAVNPNQLSRDTRPRAVALDATGMFVVGETSGLLDGQPNAGSDDIFLRRYSAAGTYIATHTVGSTAQDAATGVAIGANNRIHVSGSTRGTVTGATCGTCGDVDGVLISFDRATGAVGNVQQFGSAVLDETRAVVTDPGGDVYVVGHTQLGFNGQPTGGVTNAFIVKFTSAQAPVWTRMFGGVVSNQGRAAAGDPTGGVFIGGSTSAALPGNVVVGGADGFVAKLTAAGTVQ
jgi:hypothetical protein